MTESDPNQTSISTFKRDMLIPRLACNRTGELERRSIRAFGACAAAGNLASLAFSETATLPYSSSVWPNGQKWR